jgi:hypothetical protein
LEFEIQNGNPGLIEQIAAFFRLKSQRGAEHQVIRLGLIDFDRASMFLRSLLDQSVECEALVQPNRTRWQKNKPA